MIGSRASNYEAFSNFKGCKVTNNLLESIKLSIIHKQSAENFMNQLLF